MDTSKTIIFAAFVVLAFTACSKKSVAPGNQGGDTTVTINPQKDPALAATDGFFLNDWAPKTFTAPAYADTTKPAANATVTINVDYSNVITKVPKYLFGNNTNPYMGQIVTEPTLMADIKSLSPNVLRFPGGISAAFISGTLPEQYLPTFPILYMIQAETQAPPVTGLAETQPAGHSHWIIITVCYSKPTPRVL